MKKIRKDNILFFLMGVLITASFSVYAVTSILSGQVDYMPKDNEWNVDNVEAAIDDLYDMAKNNNGVSSDNFVGITWNYDYTGGYQIFEAPLTGEYKIELWGASGKNSGYTAAPGLGGYTSGIISLDRGDLLYIYVGEVGNVTSANYSQLSWNGGGYTHNYTSYYGRGGGATDVRLVPTSSVSVWNEFDSLKSRIMVAGGGGSGHNNASYTGGHAGGLTSYAGVGSIAGAAPATQTSGYAFGSGGPGLPNQAYSASGSGYWGGKSSTTSPCNMSYGGSSYISGHQGVKSITESSTSSNMSFTDDSIHYSGEYFVNTVMIDGKGCKWNTAVTTDCSGQPQPTGSTASGHNGNGYARITFSG